MSKKRVLIDKSIAEAIIINAIVIVLLMILYTPAYEAADDAIMSTILYGGYGYLTPRDVFQNIILTKGITKLIRWFPGVAWYTLVQVFTVYLALTVITYLVLQQNCKRLRRIVWCVFLAFVWYECYGQMQFTKTAAIASLAGILLAYRICKDECRSVIWTAFFAFVLCTLGIMWRPSAFQMMFLILFIIGLVDLFGSIKKGFGKKFFRYVIGVCAIAILYFGITVYHSYDYNQDPLWTNYLEFNGLRSELVDCGWPEYEQNVELYNSLGMTEQDVDLYDRWNYADPEIFTIDALRQLVQAKKQNQQDIVESLRNFGPKIWRSISQRGMFIPWMILLIAAFLLQPKKCKPYVIYTVILTFALEFYFLFIGRGMLNRLDASILCANGVILALLPWEEEREQKVHYGVLIASICLGLLKVPVADNVDDYQMQDATENDVKLMNSDQQAIYYTEEFTVDEFEKVTARMWGCPEMGLYSNISRLGGWKYPSPDAVGISAKYGITNPYRQMVDNSNAYLVCNNEKLIGKIEEYIQRHYNENAKAVQRKKLATASVYQIVTSTPKVSPEEAVEDETVHGEILSIKEDKGGLALQGELYKENANYFSQKMYLRIIDTRTGKATWHNVLQYANEAGEYIDFKKKITIYTEEDLKYLQFEGYVQVDGQVFKTEIGNSGNGKN